MEPVNVPVNEPLVVLVLNAVVGFVEVPQQTPLTVTAAPPLLEIIPPLVAVVDRIADAAVVVSTGITAVDVTVISFP